MVYGDIHLERLRSVQAGSPSKICGHKSRRQDFATLQDRWGTHSLPRSWQHLQALGLPVKTCQNEIRSHQNAGNGDLSCQSIVQEKQLPRKRRVKKSGALIACNTVYIASASFMQTDKFCTCARISACVESAASLEDVKKCCWLSKSVALIA